jgi:hypothetical protein
MENEKSAVDSFLGELNNESKVDAFNQVLEPKKVEDKIEDEKPLPFNKDPKVQRFIEKEINKRLSEVERTAPKETHTEENSFKETIDAFTNIIGNDTPEKVAALNALQRSLNSLDQRASEKAIEKLNDIRESEVQEDIDAENELNEAFDNIEDTFDVDITSNNPNAVKTRQEFVSYVEKIAPKDRQGNVTDYPDMISAWETYSENKQRQPNRAKDLASRSMGRSSDAPIGNQEKVNWNSVDNFIDTLRK